MIYSHQSLVPILPVNTHKCEDSAAFLPVINKILPNVWRKSATASTSATKLNDAIVHALMWGAGICS